MKTFVQMLQEFPHDDKLDKLRHASVLSPKRQKQLSVPLVHFKDFDYEIWQNQYPPSNTSLETFNELKHLQSLQQYRKGATEDMIIQDKDILGSFKKYLDEYELEVDMERIEEVYKESGAIILILKRFYDRPRPKKLAKSLGIELTEFQLKTAETPSYPSGHAVQGRLLGKLIADELPLEHRANILDIGYRMGYYRQIAGAHYSSDTVFGHRLADELYRTIKIPVELGEVRMVISEGKGASTYFEGVIAACHNYSGLNEIMFKKKILTDSTVKQFLRTADSGGKPNFATNGKSDEEKLDILYKFAKVCKKSLPGGSSDAGAGQAKMKISKPWIDITNKKIDTSKADITVSGNKTSVKGPSAQLMSGKKLETKATILAALEISGEGSKLKDDLVAAVDSFVDNTRTIGYEISSGFLKKMSPEEARATGNEKAKKIVDEQEKMKADITKLFEFAFKNSKVGDAFAKEAMTGWEKFGGKAFPGQASGDTNGEATHMLIWDYKMDRMKFLKIDDSFISKTAKKMRVRPDLKSGSYKVKGQKAGYSFYQALRVGVDVVLDKSGEIVDDAKEEIEYNKTLLREGTLNEFSFKKKVQDIMNWIKNKIMGLWKWLAEQITKIVNAVMKTIQKGIHYALQTFELDVNVTVNTTVKL